ncbi:MAG: Gfo/Idh/MocA family oxidoreductase [Pseudomonadota bacterium]
MTIKYGVVGCGMMGGEHIRYINLLPGAEVSEVFDPVPEMAEQAAVLARGAKQAESFEALITSSNVDAVVIASPNYLHVDQLEAVARHRSVPILCEKPLFTDPIDDRRIDALMRSYRAPIWVAMEYRYMPPIAEFIQRADTVTGGIQMLSLREHRFPFLPKVGDWNRFNEKTGGTLVEKCCHFFDLMRLMLGSEPVRVMATAGQITNHLDEEYEGQRPDIWDGGYVVFDFENGARAMLELCMFADGTVWNEEVSAVGSAGKIECRLPGPQRFWPSDLGEPPHPQLAEYPRSPKQPSVKTIELDPALVEAGDHHGSTFFQHQKFIEVIRGHGQPEVTLDDGRRAVRMGIAAQDAAREGSVVSLKSDFDLAEAAG